MSRQLTPQEEFDNKRAEALAQRIIEWDEIPNLNEFKQWFQIALEHCSIQKCGCGIVTWMKFIQFKDRFIFPELELAVMILKSASSKELGIKLEDAFQILEKLVLPISSKLLEIDVEISEPIRKKVLTLSSLRVPPNKQLYKGNH